MKNKQEASEWLIRAKSSLEKARFDKIPKDILYEDLCYDLQQSVEKSLKALCISNNIIFPKTHSINYLLEILEKENINIPEDIKKSKILTIYAVQTRYPGDYDPVTKMDYLEALEITESVLEWAKSLIK